MKKVAEWLEENHPSKGNHYTAVTNTETAKMPVHPRESSNSRLVLNQPKLKEEVIAKFIEFGDVVTPSKVANAIRNKMKVKINIDEFESFVSDKDNKINIVEAEVQDETKKDKVYKLKIIN